MIMKHDCMCPFNHFCVCRKCKEPYGTGCFINIGYYNDYEAWLHVSLQSFIMKHDCMCCFNHFHVCRKYREPGPHLQHSQLVLLCCQIDGSFIVLVHSSVVGPLLQQQLHCGNMAVSGRQQQWSVVVLVTPIYACASATQWCTGHGGGAFGTSLICIHFVFYTPYDQGSSSTL